MTGPSPRMEEAEEILPPGLDALAGRGKPKLFADPSAEEDVRRRVPGKAVDRQPAHADEIEIDPPRLHRIEDLDGGRPIAGDANRLSAQGPAEMIGDLPETRGPA